MAGQREAGLVIVQDGKVRFERYGLGFDAAGRWTSFSVAKSFTSTLVGAAIEDGAIKSLDDKVSQYIPDLKGSAYDDVSVRQLLTMSSGVKWNEDYEDPNSDVARFNDAKPDPGVDATVSYMRKLPRAHPPGEVWSYNTGETNLVGVLVSSATHKTLSEYLQEKIWRPGGMEAEATWLLSSTGHEIGGCCLQAATRDFARMGLVVLANGHVGGKQIVVARLVRRGDPQAEGHRRARKGLWLPMVDLRRRLGGGEGDLRPGDLHRSEAQAGDRQQRRLDPRRPRPGTRRARGVLQAGPGADRRGKRARRLADSAPASRLRERARSPHFSGRLSRMCSSRSCFGVTLRRRAHHQVLGPLVHREQDDLADVLLAGQQHDDAVDAGREPPWGGAPNWKARYMPPNFSTSTSSA